MNKSVINELLRDSNIELYTENNELKSEIRYLKDEMQDMEDVLDSIHEILNRYLEPELAQEIYNEIFGL